MENPWNLCDTTQFKFEIRTPPGYILQEHSDYSLNQNSKTYEGCVREVIIAADPDEWLRENIRRSMEEHDDFWRELAKY